VDTICDDKLFDRVTNMSLRSDGADIVDPTIYRGSAGVIYGLGRYVSLL
jgi:hypothetical protein